jgi:RNA recognition motif-containing protein
MNIFVGNLAREVTDADLRQVFEPFGHVASAAVIRDKFSGESRGFGFVDMPASAEAHLAITGLQGMPLKGQMLHVNEARPRADDRVGRRRPNGGRRA